MSEIVCSLEIEELKPYFQECKQEQSHLEKILTMFELDRRICHEKKDEIKKRIYEKIQECLTVKSLKDKDVDLEKSRALVKCMFRKNDVIITTNYDLLLEHLLDLAGIWSPRGNGYGNTVEADSIRMTNHEDQLHKNIRILKMHGSFNFFQQLLPSGEISGLICVKYHGIPNEIDDLFPSVGSDKTGIGGSDNKQALVLPTYLKPFAPNRTTMKMWHEAFEAMNDASVINLIGYSFPEADQMMSLLLSYPDANKFSSDGRKLRINILNTKTESRKIRGHIEQNLRGHPKTHIDWGEFILDVDKPDNAYAKMIESFNNN